MFDSFDDVLGELASNDEPLITTSDEQGTVYILGSTCDWVDGHPTLTTITVDQQEEIVAYLNDNYDEDGEEGLSEMFFNQLEEQGCWVGEFE